MAESKIIKPVNEDVLVKDSCLNWGKHVDGLSIQENPPSGAKARVFIKCKESNVIYWIDVQNQV